MEQIYFVEITDTFGSEANYSWVRRYRVRANTIRGAINVVARMHGPGWKNNYSDGFDARYDSASGCMCCFISLEDPDTPNDAPFIN